MASKAILLGAAEEVELGKATAVSEEKGNLHSRTSTGIGRIIDDDFEANARKDNRFGEVTVIENAKDLLTHVLRVENDTSKSPWTFRAFIIGK